MRGPLAVVFVALAEKTRPGWGERGRAQRVIIMRYFFAFLFSLSCFVAPVFAWSDGTDTFSGILNPSVDQDKVLAICSGCFFNHLTLYDYYISDVFRYQNGKVQFNSEKTLYYRGSGNVVTSCKIALLRFQPLLYFTASNLSETGDLYVFLHARLAVEPSPGGYFLIASPYVIHNVNLTTDTVADIANYSFERITRPEEWIYPLYYITTKSTCNFSTYLTQNCSIPATTSVLSQQSQSRADLVQLNSHFSASWLRASGLQGASGSLSTAGSYILDTLINNRLLYADQQLTEVCFGSPGANAGPAGYVSYIPANFSVQNDFDRGGQLDWSEFYQNKDMRNAADDKPNIDDIGSAADLPSVDIDPIPGQENLDGMFSDEVEDPTVAGFRQLYQETTNRLETTLEANPAYNQFKTFISPQGFNPNVPLPSYTQHMYVSVFGGTLDLGNVTIDFNFLREEPFKSIWSVVRGILSFSLFVMTFLACFATLEKAQAWSV